MRQRDDNHEPPDWAELVPAGPSRELEVTDIQVVLSDLCLV